MVKVSNSTISVGLWKFVESSEVVEPSKYNQYPNNGTTYLTYTADKDFTFNIQGVVNYSLYSSVNNTPADQYKAVVAIFVNWVEKYKEQVWSTTSGARVDRTFNSGRISVTTGDVITVKCWSWYYSNSNWTCTLKTKNGYLQWYIDTKKTTKYKWKPRSTIVKSIWSKESTTLFGVHSDRTRIDTLN